VVADSRRARDGRFIERIGFYNPKAPAGRKRSATKPSVSLTWQSKGAQISDTAARLVKQFGAKPAA
jgi:small subunit ribosomal protein S16